MYQPLDITLYIPCYNAQNTIGACLDAVFAQSITPAEIVLVDDGSLFPCADNRITVIRHDVNRGLGASRNTALEHCRTPLIAALDSDVKPDPSWLQELLKAFNSGNYAGAGGMMLEAFNETLGDKWRGAHMSQNWGETEVVNPRFLYGANTLFNAGLLKNAGGYDKDYRTNDEDRFISEALYKKGYSLCYTPEAVCRHLRRDTARTIIHGYWRWHYMKGVKRGDFSSPAGMKQRLQDVNFGIANYRTARDLSENRQHLLALDALIPWVFCLRDLHLFASTTNSPVCDLPFDDLFGEFCDCARRVIRHILDDEKNPAALSQYDWFPEYLAMFRQALEEYLEYTGFDIYKKEELWAPVYAELVKIEKNKTE